jgi:hypothetical protein
MGQQPAQVPMRDTDLAEYLKETRAAQTVFWKLVVTLAAGALVLSIGFLLRETNAPFPKALLPEVRCAWIVLALCLGAAVGDTALAYWGMWKQARLWEDHLARGAPYRALKWPEWVGWGLFAAAIVFLATGLAQLAHLALCLLTMHAAV